MYSGLLQQPQLGKTGGQCSSHGVWKWHKDTWWHTRPHTVTVSQNANLDHKVLIYKCDDMEEKEKLDPVKLPWEKNDSKRQLILGKTQSNHDSARIINNDAEKSAWLSEKQKSEKRRREWWEKGEEERKSVSYLLLRGFWPLNPARPHYWRRGWLRTQLEPKLVCCISHTCYTMTLRHLNKDIRDFQHPL